MNAPANVEWRTVIRFAEDEVLRPMLRGLGIDALIEIRHREEGTILSLEHATESGRLIGRDGHTLAAIQYLVNVLINKRFGATRTVLIDCAGYRGRFKANLEKLAKDAGREAQRTGEPITLEPMVAADRRVVHTALRDWPGLRTVSVDEDPETGMKRVQVVPIGGMPEAADGAEAAPPGGNDDDDTET
jgi:spoIIIJ-associated protein